jgi:hypothetical protein
MSFHAPIFFSPCEKISSNEPACLLGFLDQVRQEPAYDSRESGIDKTRGYWKPFVIDAVGDHGNGGVVANPDRQDMLGMRSGAAAHVKLDEQKAGIDGLPDGHEKHVVRGVAHHNFVHLFFICFRHRPAVRSHARVAPAFFQF